MNAVQQFSLEKSIVWSHTSCTLSLSFKHNVLQDLDGSYNDSLVSIILLHNLDALGYEAILNSNSLTIYVTIQIVVDLNQEFNRLRNHSRVLTVQGNIPDDL